VLQDALYPPQGDSNAKVMAKVPQAPGMGFLNQFEFRYFNQPFPNPTKIIIGI
jgi:hypothetical protein